MDFGFKEVLMVVPGVCNQEVVLDNVDHTLV
jgi:hypothetical protein